MSPNKKYEEVLKWTFSFGLDKKKSEKLILIVF